MTQVNAESNLHKGMLIAERERIDGKGQVSNKS
jgi:hypothetical protein